MVVAGSGALHATNYTVRTMCFPIRVTSQRFTLFIVALPLNHKISDPVVGKLISYAIGRCSSLGFKDLS
jgi:hypothetical protein